MVLSRRMFSSLVINCTFRSRLLPLKVDNRISSFYSDISVCCTTIVTYLNNFVKTQQNVGGRWLGERKHLWLLGWLVLDVFSVLENECSGQSWSVVPPLGYGRNSVKSDGFVRVLLFLTALFLQKTQAMGIWGEKCSAKTLVHNLS